MSLSLVVYCSGVSEKLVPEMMQRFNLLDMDVEISPEFSFNPEKDNGFVPFKFRFRTCPHVQMLNRYLTSGFEIYIESFDPERVKEKRFLRGGLFSKLLRHKASPFDSAPASVKEKLAGFNTEVTFIWHAANTYELRFASLASAILTELTNGVCSYPDDEIWYETQYLVENTYREIIEYEKNLSEEEIEADDFKGWGRVLPSN